MNITPWPPEIEVKKLLASVELPTVDITAEHLKHFFGAWAGSSLAGVVGVEVYDSVALLRSLAVASAERGAGVGAALLARAEHHAMENGVLSLFLLTTTAESYFTRHGYSRFPRETAPEAIQRTAEFASICPGNSAFMFKQLASVDRY